MKEKIIMYVGFVILSVTIILMIHSEISLHKDDVFRYLHSYCYPGCDFRCNDLKCFTDCTDECLHIFLDE